VPRVQSLKTRQADDPYVAATETWPLQNLSYRRAAARYLPERSARRAQYAKETAMKILALFMMLALVVTARFAIADEGARTSAAPAAALVSTAEATPVEVPAALGGPLSTNEACEEYYNDCTDPCFNFTGSAIGACVRACYRQYQECLAN
jgi:hypothetical protein